MPKKIIVAISCFLLMLLFTYTAISKLATHAMFYVQLMRFPRVSPVAGFISWAVPLAEAVVVALLFFPVTRVYGFYASCLLLVLFTVYLVLMVVFEPNLPCSCGGVIAKLSWKQHIIFNLFFIALSLVGIILHTKTNKQQVRKFNFLLQ